MELSRINPLGLKLFSVLVKKLVFGNCYTLKKDSAIELRNKLNEIIGWNNTQLNYDPEKLLKFVKEDLGYADTYAKKVGVVEGYNLEEHTLEVMKNFERYKLKERLPAVKDLNLLPLIRFALVVHDIGKPEAVENGDKNKQHYYTKIILEKEMTKLGFLDNEKNFVLALISGDPLGKVIRKWISLETAYAQVIQMKDQAGMNLKDFFETLILYYTADAYSYPIVRSLFEEKDGTLLIRKDKGEEFYKLSKMIERDS